MTELAPVKTKSTDDNTMKDVALIRAQIGKINKVKALIKTESAPNAAAMALDTLDSASYAPDTAPDAIDVALDTTDTSSETADPAEDTRIKESKGGETG